MNIYIIILALAICCSGCKQETESIAEVEWQWPPVGSIVDATESNAQYTLDLSLVIDGVTSNHVTTWHYRILQKGEEADMGIGAHMSHAGGGGGGYSIYVSPTDYLILCWPGRSFYSPENLIKFTFAPV